MGEKTSNGISSESAQQICSGKFMHTARNGLYQSCIKNCEISNFGFLAIFFVLFFFGRLTWESMGNYKMCDILETAGRRAKRRKIWTSGVSICSVYRVLFTVKFSLGSFGAFPIFTDLMHVVSWKWLIAERNGQKFGPQRKIFRACRVILTVKCSSSSWSHSVHLRFSVTLYILYLGNG